MGAAEGGGNPPIPEQISRLDHGILAQDGGKNAGRLGANLARHGKSEPSAGIAPEFAFGSAAGACRPHCFAGNLRLVWRKNQTHLLPL